MNYNLHVKPEEVITKEEIIFYTVSKVYDNTETEQDIADLYYLKDLLDYEKRMCELKYWINYALEEEQYEFLTKLKSYNLVEINKEGKIF